MKHLKTWSNNLTDLTDIDRFIIDSLVNRRFKTASYAARYQNARRQQNLYVDGSKAYIDTANFLAEIAKQGGEQVNNTSNTSLADAINESAALAKKMVDDSPNKRDGLGGDGNLAVAGFEGAGGLSGNQWPEENRIDAIGQNGGDGEHYAPTPKNIELARCKRLNVRVLSSEFGDANSGGVRLDGCRRDVVEVGYDELSGGITCYIDDSGMKNYEPAWHLPVGTYLLQDDGLYLKKESEHDSI